MKKIITISRQYGSGGREIGQKLAEHYNIPFMTMKSLQERRRKAVLPRKHLRELRTKQQTVFYILLPWA